MTTETAPMQDLAGDGTSRKFLLERIIDIGSLPKDQREKILRGGSVHRLVWSDKDGRFYLE